jgi:hypothetical protein
MMGSGVRCAGDVVGKRAAVGTQQVGRPRVAPVDHHGRGGIGEYAGVRGVRNVVAVVVSVAGVAGAVTVEVGLIQVRDRRTIFRPVRHMQSASAVRLSVVGFEDDER